MSRKYVKDYRLENQLTPSGKTKTVAVYRGDWFGFTAGPEAVAKAKKTYLVLTVGAGLLLLGLLVFTNLFDNAWYVVLPAAFSILPFALAAMSTWRLWTAKGPVTREHNAKLHDRMAPSALIFAVLAAACTVGGTVHMILTGFSPARLAYVLGAAACALCGVFMFLGRGVLKMEKTDPPKHS